MIAIVKRGDDETFLVLAPLSKLVQELVSNRLGIFVRPRPAVDVEKHHCVLGLFGSQLADTVKVHMESGNIDCRCAGLRGVIRQREKYFVWAWHCGLREERACLDYAVFELDFPPGLEKNGAEG